MTWSLKGTYFESCNCETACPCLFLSPPTEGECTALVGWHIETGTDEGVSLSGLNVALAVHSPGHMATTPWNVAVYVDARADENQNASLMKIFGGQGGGHPARLATHIGAIVGVRSVPISFSVEDGKHALTIPDIADVEIAPIAGQVPRHAVIREYQFAGFCSCHRESRRDAKGMPSDRNGSAALTSNWGDLDIGDVGDCQRMLSVFNGKTDWH